MNILDKIDNMLSELFIEKAEDDIEMLRLSMIAEFDAANLYERFAKQTRNEDIRKAMLDIAKEEKVHAGEFEALLMKLDPEYSKDKKEGYKEIKDLIGRK